MAIAIGMLTAGGVVIAADTPTTVPGYLHIAQGTPHTGGPSQGSTTAAYLFSAPGNAGYGEALMKRLARGLVENDTLTDRDALAPWLAQTAAQFHADYVGAVSDSVEPHAHLIVATQGEGVTGLWSAENGAVTRHGQFAAIGTGRLQAQGLLANLWHPYHDVRRAAMLAAYVIFHVKDEVGGCGTGTHVMYLQDNTLHALSAAEVDDVETLFRLYTTDVEPTVVHYLLGASPPTGQLISRGLRSLRRKFGHAVRC